MDRREFIAAAPAAGLLAAGVGAAGLRVSDACAAESGGGSGGGGRGATVYRSVKWGMIQTPGSVADKFRLMRELGYDGMELVSPVGLDAAEVRAASDATGMPVHGVVNMRHWKVRLSDPDPAVRERSRAILEECLREADAFGGDSVLLVPGRVNGAEENHDHVWSRSIAEVRKVLPLAGRLGVRVLVENVWNGFCESPEEFRDYLDEIGSPWVGAYFDIGNARKFAPSEEWVRVLGPRIVKLDVKGWGAADGFCKIGDGDVDWPAVCAALAEVGFHGWSTAEVKGGDRERLAEIAGRLDRVFRLETNGG